ncbi:tyrosine-type recombinase/integrase [Faecalicatena orotica]|uniref:Site-specific recombinase XerD n=1 Tax=Faecalicatena orotica TaxID=1544 RepID=A0A2Y9BJ99_9FIRM|nr:tyrosine-type recombinase/integrase [Faecalicatena orotica]PWJ22668.1 site-specific recombinase XerD [Faecalicatena orotica]SSA58110.1 Site-specific recombinase XerD [Faecalicatena orotica]
MDKPVTFSDITSLHTLVTCANMSADEVFKDFKIMANKKILEKHIYEIYYSESEKSWRTYLPDDTKPNNRRPIKRKSKENLEKEIIGFYIEKQEIENRTNITLEDLYVEWLLYKRDYTSVKAKTIQEYVAEWNKFFKDTTLSKMKLGDIKPITLIRFFREVTRKREHTHKRISNARSVLNGIMCYAIEEEIISHNPVSDVNFKQFTYKPVEIQSDNVFSRDDTFKLLNYLNCIIEPYSLAIQLSFYLFIRIGETKAIRWEDIDYEKRVVYLHRQATCERVLNDDLSFSKREIKVVNQMKGNTSHGFRKQFLTDEAIKILHKAKELNPNGTYVFEPDGTIMTTDSFNRRLKKYCKEAGVPYHSSHKIRFYNASTAFDGNNLTTLSYLMGHSETATTLHYLRNVNKGKNDMLAFQKLGISS